MRIPFELPDFDDGLDEAKGSIYLEDEFLVIRLDIGFLGLTTDRRELIKAEAGIIGGIRFEPKFTGDWLIITTDNTQLLQAVPGDHVSDIKLKTQKKHRNDVFRFVVRVEDWIKNAKKDAS